MCCCGRRQSSRAVRTDVGRAARGMRMVFRPPRTHVRPADAPDGGHTADGGDCVRAGLPVEGEGLLGDAMWGSDAPGEAWDDPHAGGFWRCAAQLDARCTEQVDCPSCSHYQRAEANGLWPLHDWCCWGCVVGRREAWEGVKLDRIIGGLYKEGHCDRCGDHGILLMAVERRHVAVAEDACSCGCSADMQCGRARCPHERRP